MNLLTVKEIAFVLQVSPATIYYWVSRNEIPVLRVGKHLRFDRDVVLAHFKQKTQDSLQPFDLRLNVSGQPRSLKSNGSLALKKE